MTNNEDGPGDGLWLSYSRAADSLGMQAASVRRMARRMKLPRRTDNLGTVEVRIPHHLLLRAGADLEAGREDAGRSDGGGDEDDARAIDAGQIVTAIEAASAGWREALRRADERADQARAEADTLRIERDAAVARAEQAEDQLAAARSASLPARVWRALRGG